jgi:thiosulfate dehydrogenase (quinone) large subunit
MTKQTTYVLTAVSVVLYLLLSWIFGDRALLTSFWNSDEWHSSALITYVLAALIVVAGVLQAQRLGDRGVNMDRPATSPQTVGQVRDPRIWELLMGNVYLSLFWLPLRFFVGRQWFSSGWGKTQNEAWTDTGFALRGYWERVVQVPEEGSAPIYYDWYRDFIQHMLDNEWYSWFGALVAYGEVLVGLGLIFGGLVGFAAFFGTLMNVSFMLAGTASSNPVLFGLGVFLVLAWKVAGYWGIDRFLLPVLGTPWGRLESVSTKPAPDPSDPEAVAPPARRSSRGTRSRGK